MPVAGVQAGQGPEPVQPTESKKERQKLFEIQWEIDLISTYVAITQQNGTIGHQLNSLKKGLNSGEPPEKLIAPLNQLIDGLNKGMLSDVAPFPPFDLTSGGNEHKALGQYALTLEKYLNVAAEQGKISWEKEEQLFNQTNSIVSQIGAIPHDEVVSRINEVIAQANQYLPLNYQLHGIGLS